MGQLPLAQASEEEEDPPDSPADNTKVMYTEPAIREKGSFFVEQTPQKLTIKSGFTKSGIRLKAAGKSFDVLYPNNIWSSYPPFLKQILSENLAFVSTLHLPYLLNNNAFYYQLPSPATKDIMLKGFELSLPSTALMKSEKTSDLLKKFSETKKYFRPAATAETVPRSPRSKKSAVLFFTFGKDSLLTYGACKEIGIDTIPIFIKEPVTEIENYHKEQLAHKFRKEFGEEIFFINNKVGLLREPDSGLDNEGWYGWELQLTQFVFISLPVAFFNKARYLFLSNEQSCNDKFLDQEGFWCNPVYEQSTEWTKKIKGAVRLLGMKNLRVGSLLEPLHEIAIIKILHNRYPQIAKYQTSCGENKRGGKENRWCGNCSKCARNYIFLLANRINPKSVGIPTKMLDFKYKNKFSLFEDGNGKGYGYDKSRLGRDEQLLGFYMAYKNGCRGELIDLFKNLYLGEAKKREPELRKRFFGIHSTSVVPSELEEKLLNIYRQELKKLI